MSEATPYTRASLPVEGGFLEYGQWGSATAPPIIALHGVTSTHMDWVTFGENANDRLRVIAPDLRGRGRSSDIDGPWGMPAHARDVVALMDAMCIERGVLGPREAPKVWYRHLLNCAIAADAVEQGATVADVGSGAGLPGLAWSIRRPDVQVVLIDSLLRRTTFLTECVRDLGLEARVSVSRGRVEDWTGGSFDVVTSRAVAPLDRLLRWCSPLCRPGGRVVALKGTSAADEVTSSAETIARVSDSPPRVKTYGSDVLKEPTTVVEIGVDRPLGAAH